MKHLFITLACTFVAASTFATGISQNCGALHGFIENKGQIIDQHNRPNRDVLYLYNAGNVHVQLRQHGFSYEVIKTESKPKANPDYVAIGKHQGDTLDYTYHIHRVDVTFAGSNVRPEIIAQEPASDYINYYTTGTPEEGVTNVHHYKKVLYRNVYSNIDVEFVLSEPAKFKYNFIVHPGGNPKDIQLKFDGADRTSLTGENHILIETAYGNIEESIPETYQLSSGKEKHNVSAAFIGSTVDLFGIHVASYDPAQTLIIDPWATYFGGNGGDEGKCIATDAGGNVLIAGSTTSTSAIATSGAYQLTLAGTGSFFDAFVAKFSAWGTRLWATYYGGTNDDWAIGIATDTSSNVLITGHTASWPGGIASPGAYQTAIGGVLDPDAFIAKFSASGTRIWSTYYGGSASDRGCGIASDAAGNVLVTGYTISASGIASSGSYQSASGGTIDVFIAKFDASGARLWATYYGGPGSDYANGIATDANGNVLVTGYTYSTSSIASSGAYQTAFGGGVSGYDAFVVKFNGSGSRLWATYYGGNSLDQGCAIAADTGGNVLLAGYTYSNSGIASAGAYQTTIGSSVSYPDAFVVKFNAAGVRLWATYYGGPGEDNGRGIATDLNGNILLTGWTGSTSAIATTGAYQPTSAGGMDVFIVKFDSGGLRQWASYYGGSADDYGTGIATAALGNIVITGITESASGIATSGAYQSVIGSTRDAFVSSFSSAGSLPVSWLSLTATAQHDKSVLLNWQTASETNNKGFEVERSTNATDFESIGFVNGNEHTSAISSYQFTDDISNLHPSTSVTLSEVEVYYRLKQIDFDGRYEYSKTVSVGLINTVSKAIYIHPNPGAGSFTLSFGSDAARQINVYDVMGNVVSTFGSSASEVQIELNGAAKGIYFIRAESESGQVHSKFVVE